MQQLKFTNQNRAERVKVALSNTYDLIVIGGGITGAGIALDASLRGLSTLLVEKRDFASGTSSKSTKLIHGGLRYLKQLEFGLVRETGLERAVAHKNIPHLVHPETMMLPIVKGGTFTKFTASMAISVYDWMADVTKKDRKRILNKEGMLKAEPLLNEEILKSGVAYSEYRTDDARLTIELIKAACREGAVAFNYMKVEDFIYENNSIVGVKCVDRLQAKSTVEFKGKHIVSAAGPWVDKLRAIDGSVSGKSLHLTKGVHIVVPKSKLNLSHSVYFDAFDNRMIFAIPRGLVTYIGTSDTNYNHSLDRVLCTNKDIRYLLSKVNKTFPSVNLVKEDVISSWAGLRPLIHEDGKSPSELSRKDEIFISDNGLISIAGGKLTGFRKMAKKIVDLIIKKQDKNIPCKTKTYKIHKDSFSTYREYQDFLKKTTAEFQHKGITEYNVWFLVTNYGKTAKNILEKAANVDGNIQESLIKEEIRFVIANESCYYPADFFNRRSGRLYFDVESVKKYLSLIVDIFSKSFDWTQEEIEAITLETKQQITDVTVFGDNDAKV